MTSVFPCHRVEAQLSGSSITFETGRLANQAGGAVWVQCGGTVVLVTVCSQTLEEEKGFFPLVVDYQEMSYAAGRIPGGYFRREIGRPSEREILVCRLIDRPCRPLFPEGFRDEVQIIATVLSADQINDPDVLALTGASAALGISSVPFDGPIAGARIGYVDGNFILNPSSELIAAGMDLNIVMAASKEAVVMVEGGGNFVSEELIADALEWGHKEIMPLLEAQEKLREAAGKPKKEFVVPESRPDLEEKILAQIEAPLQEALNIPEKLARREAKSKIKSELLEFLHESFPEDASASSYALGFMEKVEKRIMRSKILNTGVRNDGRDVQTVRPIKIEVGALPRTHGSCLFARGETKVLAVATLGSAGDEQRIETLMGEASKRFMLHYNFPPYCVGEVKMLRGPSRREIGHGALAERSLTPVLPASDDFPFTMRIVSETMESNGSSSMATVCGASLALMDAGTPIKSPVAGIAMGLIKEEDKFIILTDILGDEDALGDMDFKVAGTKDGVTGIQMDIKITGIPQNVMRQALFQAKEARMHILGEMDTVLDSHRTELSPFAPQLEIVQVSPSKIKEIIGPGGKVIKNITAETGASIDIEDTGKVSIFAPTMEALAKAKEMVLSFDQKAELGRNYPGKVIKIIDCGAIIEILPGLDGLLHVSQLDLKRIENVTDAVSLGQELLVKVIEVESGGRVRLSRKAVLMEEAGETVDLADFSKPSSAGSSSKGPRRDGGADRRRGGGGRRN